MIKEQYEQYRRQIKPLKWKGTRDAMTLLREEPMAYEQFIQLLKEHSTYPPFQRKMKLLSAEGFIVFDYNQNLERTIRLGPKGLIVKKTIEQLIAMEMAESG